MVSVNTVLLAARPLATDWQAFADQATVLGVAVALAVGIATTIVMIRQEKVTRDGQRLQREQAEATAARSEAAAALTEEYTRRVVEALETMAGNSQKAVMTSKAGAVRWTLVHQHRSRYLLTNVGNGDARNVQVSAHESLPLFGLDEAPKEVGPHETISFLAARTFGTKDSTITVTWTDPETGGDRTWKYPLPPEV
ncbi:hypothetical protein [Micromonospora coriariae]|uniref:hypothetical protein n=1 Tax=Micromonospora coriariae TaxID=285665 RepID=UPI000B5AE6A5|nr:hypothetical protein [Micromonospora coriariae]